jgi:hypothetical protein
VVGESDHLSPKADKKYIKKNRDILALFDKPPHQTITDDVAFVRESGNLSLKADKSISKKRKIAKSILTRT